MHAARPLTISDWVPPILAARPVTKSHPTPAKRPATTCLTEQAQTRTDQQQRAMPANNQSD